MAGKSSVIGCRLFLDEIHEVDRLSAIAGKKPAAWLRDLVLDHLKNNLKPPGPAPDTWRAEWTAMIKMTRHDGLKHFVKLQAGRPLPDLFSSWSVEERIEWLDANWPLGKK